MKFKIARTTTMTTTVDEKIKEKIGPALGKIVSGVYIVTVGKDSARDGMLATWIVQAGFNPPMLTVAIQKDRAIFSALKEGAEFGVNVLSKENMDIFKNFAKPHEDGIDRFEGLDLLEEIDGPPAFKNAVSYLRCKVKEILTASDHDLVLGEVVDARLIKESGDPMFHTRKNGFQY